MTEKDVEKLQQIFIDLQLTFRRIEELMPKTAKTYALLSEVVFLIGSFALECGKESLD